MPSTSPALTMSLPDAGSAIDRNASRRASAVGAPVDSVAICLQTFCRRPISTAPRCRPLRGYGAWHPIIQCFRCGRNAPGEATQETSACLRTMVARVRGGRRVAVAPAGAAAVAAAAAGRRRSMGRRARRPRRSVRRTPGRPRRDGTAARLRPAHRQAAGLRPLPAWRRRPRGRFTGGRGLALIALARRRAVVRQRLLPRAARRTRCRAALRRLSRTAPAPA